MTFLIGFDRIEVALLRLNILLGYRCNISYLPA